MTGIADLYLYLNRPNKDRRKRLLAHLIKKDEVQRFVVLSWKRTGSNLLCGMLHLHPEICMHNELFNPIDIFTYHPFVLNRSSVPLKENGDVVPGAGAGAGAGAVPGDGDGGGGGRWTVQIRDLYPESFLDYIWEQRTIDRIMTSFAWKGHCKAVGFKSFPEHWTETRNEDVWRESILEDLRVKKIVLTRRDELAVYVSMKRADQTGSYMTHRYPNSLKIHVDPADFQAFVNNYRFTFEHKYRSPILGRDTLIIEYEQLVDEEMSEKEILPKLWNFLGVDNTVEARRLKETIKQADPDEDISKVISNYDELEFCFRHSDVDHFVKCRDDKEHDRQAIGLGGSALIRTTDESHYDQKDGHKNLESWSILLPICSRSHSNPLKVESLEDEAKNREFNLNRFTELSLTSQHLDEAQDIDAGYYWTLLNNFSSSLKRTSSQEQLAQTEVVVGIDLDDKLFQNENAKEKIRELLPIACTVVFVNIQPKLYGHVCKIWNFLASKTKNNFIVLLGDDVELVDMHWQGKIVEAFKSISKNEGLPFGAACVALNDLSFPGFPTFPVIHRWHIQHFGRLLPKQFVNQGGDPFLYDLYARFNASDFVVSARMKNTIGGDGDARYMKHQINWRGQILNMNLKQLREFLGGKDQNGVVLDVVVPSYRTNNIDYLERIVRLRASINLYVKFWIVVDNPLPSHLTDVKDMADRLNGEQAKRCGNYFINVLHYSANRGASYARNFGFNFSTADWVLFLDDDVIPDENLFDAYAGAIRRYPNAKVFVGMTELPEACNLWTQMLCACNVGYFYSIAKRMVSPSWGVTANLMVRGSRSNSTIQFKEIYPRTGGGEDIDLVYQFKRWYHDRRGCRVTAAVPEAKVTHPWWNKGNVCYRQIMGWAWGDSLCIEEWKQKTFLAFPNWIEMITFIVPSISFHTGNAIAGLVSGLSITLVEHMIKARHHYVDAKRETGGGFLSSIVVALGAGSIISSQEVTRVAALIYRRSWFSIFRRVDWFDGDKDRIKLDIQLTSFFRFVVNAGITWASFSMIRSNKQDHR